MKNVFFELHSENPREGPGCLEDTSKAFSVISNLPRKPRILDTGSGPEAQTPDLSRLTDGKIVAVDNHLPFVETLNRKIHENGLNNRVLAVRGDMFELGFRENSFDLIWSEGAIYIIGFEKGLVEWQPLLKDGGYIAVSELTWIKPEPPPEVADFWGREYQGMKDI